ncbi:DUF2911 domain-containing protein [Rufibacter roseus]|uniref:DUF2911 domain-containing protein n=1 Tax=Rufibacter roseus TaxID=1567108 RepID=A0ABW2DSC6_9BACT|nr:DUF2911 domain-containing protein [Rufibacter roseus]
MFKIVLSTILSCFVALSALAQTQIPLPQPSPNASVSHTIGVTEVTVQYSAPGVKKRQIWGKLVPYGQVWRAGANEATVIQFSTPAQIAQEKVPAGIYSLFVFPLDSARFDLILNKQASLWGTEDYDPKQDLIRVSMRVQTAPYHETLQYSFTNVLTSSAILNLNWENKQLSVPIRVETHALTLKAIKDSLATAKPTDWSAYAQATNYLLTQNSDHETALDWINKSISIEENFYNVWLKAKLLAQKNEFEAAWELNKKAQQLGKKTKDAYQSYAQEIEDAAILWREKRFNRN